MGHSRHRQDGRAFHGHQNQQIMLEPLLLGATRNRHGHRVSPALRKAPDGKNTRTRNPCKQHLGVAKKRHPGNHLPERQVHRTTGRGGPHYPIPNNWPNANKTPVPVRPRSPPGSGEWESDEEVGEPAIFRMEEHACLLYTSPSPRDS